MLFTSSTIITSAVLFQGFAASGKSIATVVLGFLQICAGVVLLQLSKSAKELPDAAVFKGDLDQVREVASMHEPESEPKADSIRGAAAIVRQLSTKRQHDEQEEVNNRVVLRPVHEEHTHEKKGHENETENEKHQPLPRLRNRTPRTTPQRTPSGRQFSFTTMLNRLKPSSPIPRPTLHPEKQALKNASEEERLGLVSSTPTAHQSERDHRTSRSSDSTLDNEHDSDSDSDDNYGYGYGYDRKSHDSESTLGDSQALLNHLHQSLDEAQLDYQSDRQVSGGARSISVHDFQPVPPLHSHSAGGSVSALPLPQSLPRPQPPVMNLTSPPSLLSTLPSADQLRLQRSSSGWRRGNDV